ncbi:aldehyde dehydrogenase family protein [Cupriavidus metallidurans]|uniref:Aldehyde dehydrogenase family protein n=1 Tax=Cupriavidus metallidurans TaxID=119219 RepID=A0A482J0B7_9BURK|nr:aldehyde dehydrogenase family protein [Cupriavidus metallidurans]QBP12544.1 aldehyde dehydrogenase family protein [Cupriavidus metallidurans]
MIESRMTIGGRTREVADYFSVRNPATNELLGLAPNGSQSDLDAAVASAHLAFGSWSRRTDEELREFCIAIAKKIYMHSEELARIVTQEQGKPLNGFGSRWELAGAVAWATATADLSLPSRLLQANEQATIELSYKPLGVVGSITPWNFPVLIAIWHILPALRTGNTVVIKPSPYAPLAALRLVELLNEVLPEGVLNSVSCNDRTSNLGAAMSSDLVIRKVVFTGSCATGQRVMQSAALTMKRLTLELGGNDAGIVLADADPKDIAENLFWGAFINSGQTCAAMKRLYVHERIHDDVCEELVSIAKQIPMGNGLSEYYLLGPVQNRVQFDKVDRLVEAAKKKGEVILGGAADDGLFFPATLVCGLENGDALVDEEQFGPALPIIRFSDEEAAIRAANDSRNGLGGSVWSRDIEHARAVARRLECGSVWVNRHGLLQPNAPFGGTKSSGFGVAFASEGLREYTDIQVLHS